MGKCFSALGEREKKVKFTYIKPALLPSQLLQFHHRKLIKRPEVPRKLFTSQEGNSKFSSP